MPQWSDAPGPAPGPYAFRIVRTPATTPVDAIVTSANVHGTPTHFVSNRTIPCEGQPLCKLCEQGHSWRWHGYVSAILVRGLEHVIFEFTAQAAETFRTYLTTQPTLRGCHFLARRPCGRLNGRVIIQAKPEDLNRTRLPDPPDVRQVLCHIWGVQYTPDDAPTIDRPPFKRIRLRPDAEHTTTPGNGRRQSAHEPA